MGRAASVMENGLALVTWDPKAVNRRGAVSPTMRACPRSTAVTTPERAVGSTTDQACATAGTPRARERLPQAPGTTRRTSSTTLVTEGSRITTRASEAANPE